MKQRKNANPPVAKECTMCHTIFYVPPSELKVRSGKFCSLKCRGQAYTGELSPRWKGGRLIRSGYVYIYSPNHPNKVWGGYVCEHRLVMEKQLGRILDKSEIVHHINEDTTDNRIENLVVVTHKQHSHIHIKGKKQSPEHIRKRFASRNK